MTASDPAVLEEETQPDAEPSPTSDIIDCPYTSFAPHLATSVNLGTQGDAVSDGGVRTRAGRLVKSVNRLLESMMIQKPFVENVISFLLRVALNLFLVWQSECKDGMFYA